jgi:hypothetical protein
MRTLRSDSDDVTGQFTIRQMAIGIAVIGVILALAVQAPWMLIAAGDAILIGFGVRKLARALLAKDRPKDATPRPRVWGRIAIATTLAVLILGFLIGWLCPVTSN